MLCSAKHCMGSVPNVVEKGIGISYPIGKPTNRKGGYTDEERIPQGTGINHPRAGVIAGRVCRTAAGAIRSGGCQAAVDGSRRCLELDSLPGLYTFFFVILFDYGACGLNVE